MTIKPIKTKKDYNVALAKIDKLLTSAPDTKKGDELEVLSVLIEKYEQDNFEILPPDPVEAIKFRMEQIGLEKKDLAKIIGANRVSEILQRKRSLTINMIKRLHTSLQIPTDSLIG
jgi:HTH-type transcriptional regulator / antitoxin HigA